MICGIENISNADSAVHGLTRRGQHVGHQGKGLLAGGDALAKLRGARQQLRVGKRANRCL